MDTMNAYTLRKTGLSDDPQAEDWQPNYKGIPVGRIYLGEFAGTKRYRWSIYINHWTQPAEGVALMGFADAREEATAAFKESFEALIRKGMVRI